VILSMAMIVLGTGASVLAVILVRRKAPPGGHLGAIPAASGIFGVVGTGFAVLLAFVIFSAFDSYHAARQYVGTESVALRQLSSTAAFFPPADRDTLQAQLICYGRAVVQDEWPRMQQGQESALAGQWLVRMDQTVQAMPLQNDKEIAALSNWFSQNQQRQEGRRGRLAESTAFVPGFVWFLLLVLVVVTMGYACLFADPEVEPLGQVAGAVALAATLVAGLALVWVLDRPFNDRGAAIGPARMQAVVQTMEAGYASSTPLPCGPSGQPTS
jgi:hypothetical protein